MKAKIINLILKNFFIKELLYNICYLVFGFLFFLLIYYFKRNYFPAEIIYNEGVYLSIICSLIYCLPLFIKKIRKCFLILGLVFLINYSFIATFPTLIDRSISIMILKTLNKKSLNIEELKNNYISYYSNYKNVFQVDKRIEEQKILNNIGIDSKNKYFLTKKGKRFLKITDFIKNVFNINESYKF